MKTHKRKHSSNHDNTPFAPITSDDLVKAAKNMVYGDPELRENNGIKLNDFVKFDKITGANRGRVVGFSSQLVFVAPIYELDKYESKVSGVIGHPFDYSEVIAIPPPLGSFNHLRAENVNCAFTPKPEPLPEKKFRLKLSTGLPSFDLGKTAQDLLAS